MFIGLWFALRLDGNLKESPFTATPADGSSNNLLIELYICCFYVACSSTAPDRILSAAFQGGDVQFFKLYTLLKRELV